MGGARTFLLYCLSMTRVYLADANIQERKVLRNLLLDLEMEVVGEASDWATVLNQVPTTPSEILLIEWELLPKSSNSAIATLRAACPNAIVIVLISHMDANHQAAISAEVDVFISKTDLPERLIERLRAVEAGIPK